MTATEIGRNHARPAYDAESDVVALAAGSGILLTQAFALFPGLLPCLILLLPFLLPLVVLGAAAALLIGLPVGLWRLASRGLRSHSPTGIRQLSDTPQSG